MNGLLKPKIIGIVNITEDSFSDGGKFLEPEAAVRQAAKLIEDGADIIELGPASSHPDSTHVSAEEEISRLRSVIDKIEAMNVPISIDSFQIETMRFGLQHKAAFLNDTAGFADKAIYPGLAQADCSLIIVHSIHEGGMAARAEYSADVIMDRIFTFFDNRLRQLEAAGIQSKKFILDPGMGFFIGSTPEPSIEVLRNIKQLRRKFGLPLCISVSRKSFLQKIVEKDAGGATAATLAAEIYASLQGAEYIRTHDAGAIVDALKVLARLWEID